MTKMTAREARKRTRPGQASRRDHDRQAPTPGQAARQRSAALVGPAPERKVRPGYTPAGTKHERVVRKGYGGRRLPIKLESPGWQVARGPRRRQEPSPANLRAAALVPDDLQATDVVIPSRDVPGRTAGQPRRRDRRPALVAAAKRVRRGAVTT